MPVPALFVANSIQIKTAGALINTWLDQVSDLSMNLGIKLLEDSSSGEVDREFVAIMDRMPTFDVNTSDLTFLSTCGLSGAKIAPDASNPGLVAWGKAVTQEGDRDGIASLTHLKMLCTDGLMVPKSLSGRQGQKATLSYTVHAIKGSAAQSGAYPIVVTKDQAITSGQSATSKLFTPCEVRYNSGGVVIVAGIQSIEVNFGIEVFKMGSDGEVDPTFVALKDRKPVYKFTTTDARVIDTVGEGGLDCSSFEVYFQKMAADGERVAKGTGQHLSIISTKGLLYPEPAKFPHNSSGAEAAFSFCPVKNTNLLTIAINATIP
jgi:hypothetical protein